MVMTMVAMAEGSGRGEWPAGLVELYRERYAPMVRLAYLLTGSTAAAEEVVQDAFVRVHRSWSRARAPEAYLRAAVVNGTRSWGRRQSLERSHLRVVREPVAAPPDDGLWDVLATLPHRQRAAIVLRYYDDRPDDEIAALLGCRPATVRTAIHRGLAAMRKEIDR